MNTLVQLEDNNDFFLDVLLLVILTEIAIRDVKDGLIKNRDMLIYYGIVAAISIYKDNWISFLWLSFIVILVIFVIGEKIPLEYLGGGDIKYIIITALLLRSEIWIMLLWSLSTAIIFALFFRQKRIRMAPFFLVGILMTYYR